MAKKKILPKDLSHLQPTMFDVPETPQVKQDLSSNYVKEKAVRKIDMHSPGYSSLNANWETFGNYIKNGRGNSLEWKKDEDN